MKMTVKQLIALAKLPPSYGYGAMQMLRVLGYAQKLDELCGREFLYEVQDELVQYIEHRRKRL